MCVDSEFYGDQLIIGFSNDRWGKSWATVSNLIRKRCPSADLLPITEAIEVGEHPRVVKLVEDGLFSGTEITAVLDSLRGVRGPARTQKVEQLKDVQQLFRLPIRLQFGVVCDYGEARLRNYCAKHGLPNLQVSVPSASRKIRVLKMPSTPTDIEANQSASEDPSGRVEPHAFQDDKGWKSTTAKERALRFCTAIGEQLWSQYVSKKGFDLLRWPSYRIKRCALGMDGLGLTFAFPHSVPKATLPLFWARGLVKWEDAELDWNPLFPNSDS